jgi:MFS family permease
LPAIGGDLHVRAAGLSWAINAYLLPLSALLLLGGAAGDYYGRRQMLITGILVFALASVGCALASGLHVLLACRTIQGIGAAIVMPNSLGILGSSFEGEARGRAVGTWAAAGAILATAALGSLAWALTLWSSHHTASFGTWVGLSAATILLLFFVLAEHRLGERAMMPLSLFASRPFVGLTVLTFLLYGALGGLLVLLPYLLIVAGAYSPVQAGLGLLPFSIVIGAASRLTGRLTERVGPRWPLTAGAIVTGVGFALLVRIDPHASYWTNILPGMAVIAFGMAWAVAPLTTAVLSSVDRRHTGTASGFK